MHGPSLFGSDRPGQRLPISADPPRYRCRTPVELVTCKQASQIWREAKAPNQRLVVLWASRRLRMETAAVDSVGFGSIVGCAAWGHPYPHQ